MINVLVEHDRSEFRHLGNLWAQWFLYARTNARGVFMQGPTFGDVCAITKLEPAYMSGQRYTCEDNGCLNNDPFQGELMSWVIYFSSMLDKAGSDLL